MDATDLAGAWDAAVGDVSSDIEFEITDPAGNDVILTDNKFEAVSGIYTVSATYGGKNKEFEVEITVPAVPTAEWATGNESVKATFAYDITNSEDPAEAWWSFKQYDSNRIVQNNNQAYKDEGMWWKNSYVGLKPLMYTTVANAVNPMIRLGYYNGDFKMTSTPVQSVYPNPSSGWDYRGLIYTFRDTASSNYFTVRFSSGYGVDTKINVSYNGGAETGYIIAFSFIRRNSGTWNSSGGDLWPLAIKYDVENNVIKSNRNLSTVISLSDFGLTTAFETYTVDMTFTNVAAGHTAKLCVYSLNDYDLTTETKYTLEDNTHNEVLYATESGATTTDGTVDLNGVVKCWHSFYGDVSGDVSYTVADPASQAVSLSDGVFTALTSGDYTLSASYGENTEKNFTYSVSFPTGGAILKSARLNLTGKIGVQFLVSADRALYDALGGKVIFSVADVETEVDFSDWTAYGNDFIVECKVAAKQMTDTITVKFADKNGAETGETTYSVKTYADYVIENSDSSNLVDLAKAMLNYGAYAQVYFDYHTERLANVGLWDENDPVIALDGITAAGVSVSGAIEGISMSSLTLGLETTTDMYVLFNVDGAIDIADITFSVGGNTLTPVSYKGAYYVVIPNIAAKDLDTVYELNVSYGGDTATYSFSAQSYISAAFNYTGNANFKNLLKAIQLYNEKANVYFGV